ncbi:uncharacterized protein LOC131953164 [Physella acuta]|uniref:uncharacterized protein LOC131953164 n=1 Tax=Physella acuta TaxID=109671 RepID=UPI0027DC3585|nr:uncharacterized protein LOC131953164 [Physella acuta]
MAAASGKFIYRFHSRLSLHRLLIKRYLSSDLKTLSSHTYLADNVQYPLIKPKYPPGSWGDMEPSYAWQWHELKQKMLSIPNVEGRLETLLNKRTMAMIENPIIDPRVHNFKERVQELIESAATTMVLEPNNFHPATLPFRLYATKTVLLPCKNVPLEILDNLVVNDLEILLKDFKNHINDHLLLEHEWLDRNRSAAKPAKIKKIIKAHTLIKCISNFLIAQLGKDYTHLKTAQYDEHVTVRALWNRYGFERKKQKYIHDPDIVTYVNVQDQCLTYEGKFDLMLRSHMPLPQFESRTSGKSIESEAPKLMYKPCVYGQADAGRKQLKNILAGHRLGDPCEFGLLSFIITRGGEKASQDTNLAFGLTSTFSWLAAQACNQGFSHILDLTYPMTSQTVLTDGQNFRFLAYQLNTLELWKDDAANRLVNLCWVTEQMPLYHSIQNGKVNELNEEVLQRLIKTFALAPAVPEYDPKQTITDKERDLANKQDFVPKKIFVEETQIEEQYIV